MKLRTSRPVPNTRVPDRTSRKVTATAVLLMLLCTTGARAEDLGTTNFSFSGFGTLGLAHSTEDQADFTNSPFTKPNGAGHTRNWSADTDSRVGLQVIANVTPQVSAVLQVIAQQRYDNTYTPAVEWANIKYTFSPDFNVRFGRIAMPTSLVGDYRYVGYSTPWVRPPVELYGQIPISNNDGADASYRLHIGEVASTFQVSYGSTEIKLPGESSPAHLKNAVGIFNTTEYGPASFHVAYQDAKFTLDSVKPLFDAFRQFGPTGVAIADIYEVNNKRISLLSFGANYDPGDWFLMGEWSKGDFTSLFGTQVNWYVSSGYRIGSFTPYVIYSKSKKDGATSDPGLDLTLLPPFLVGSASALNAGLNSLLQTTAAQTISIGSRWDFKKNAALKVQFDHTKLDDNSSGNLINLQPGYQRGGTFNVLSVALDFVF